MLRYKVDGFETLTLRQKIFIYYLQEAALWGRDILFDQNGRYNLEIRTLLERLYTGYKGDRDSDDFKAFEEYLKRVWFSNGIHHHYGCEKFVPHFSRQWFVMHTGCSDKIADIIFNPDILPKRVNLAEGQDLVLTSACNYYQGVTQQEAETFYAQQKALGDKEHP
ncbi:MAG: dihydrofolate reductase, partial [Bacteroidales bacterium]|nr:dihydrofolate reductase [Bacteroidales bacterium]